MILIPNLLVITLATFGAISIGGMFYHFKLAPSRPTHNQLIELATIQTKYKILEIRNEELKAELYNTKAEMKQAYDLIMKKLSTK